MEGQAGRQTDRGVGSASKTLEKRGEIILLENFKSEYYTCDKNNPDSLLGRGAFGDVHKARLKDNIAQSGLPDEIAIKEVVIKTPEAKHTKTEWNLLEKGINFQNSNLVTMFCLSIEPSNKNKQILKIYMELCEHSLHDVMEDQTRPELSVDELKHVTAGVLNGLDHLHLQGIIHRDVKPKNILLKTNITNTTSLMNMTIKLTDFNVSKWSSQDDITSTQTPMIGTDAFRAPEVLLFRDDGHTHYGIKSDIWSVGILVFQMWTKCPFASEREIRSADLDGFINRRIETVSEQSLHPILNGCLKKWPSDRLSARDLLDHFFLQTGKSS